MSDSPLLTIPLLPNGTIDGTLAKYDITQDRWVESDRIKINDDGSVELSGNTSLIGNSGASSFTFSDNTTTMPISMGSIGDKFRISIGGTPRHIFDAEGRLGLGVLDPTVELQVNGAARLKTRVYFEDSGGAQDYLSAIDYYNGFIRMFREDWAGGNGKVGFQFNMDTGLMQGVMSGSLVTPRWTSIVTCTQAEYDALSPSPDANVMYVVVG